VESRADAQGQGAGGAAGLGRRAAAPAAAATHIWWGPIASEEQAREIIAWTAWSLLLIAVAPFVALTFAAAGGRITLAAPFWENRGDNWLMLGQALFLTVESAAAVLLILKRNWVAAMTLLVCCLTIIGLLLATIVRLGMASDLGVARLGELAVLEACLVAFTRLVWRAMSATRALPKLALTEHFS
jgi:hypothetical protein